jgi:hypothetical protein
VVDEPERLSAIGCAIRNDHLDVGQCERVLAEHRDDPFRDVRTAVLNVRKGAEVEQLAHDSKYTLLGLASAAVVGEMAAHFSDVELLLGRQPDLFEVPVVRSRETPT